PLTIFDGLAARRRWRVCNRFCKFLAQRVVGEQGGIRDDGFDFFFQLRFIAAAKNELRNKIRGPPRGFAERHTQSQKVFGVHLSYLSEMKTTSSNPVRSPRVFF